MSIPPWASRSHTTPAESEWRDALATIESQELDITLNVASDYGSFFKAVAREPVVRLLIAAMFYSGDAREQALGRLHDLAHLDVDSRYQNPYDTAMAILLWATYFTAPRHVYSLANTIDRTHRTWYSRKLAGHIINPAPNSSGNGPQQGPQPGLPQSSTQALPGTFDVWPKETYCTYQGSFSWASGTAGP